VIQKRIVDLDGTMLYALQQRNEAPLELGKQRPQGGDRRSRLINIEERVVGRTLKSEVLGFFPFEQ
jgi:hypothetical protein